MIGDAVKEITGILDQRFLMYVFLPALAFSLALLAVWYGGRGELTIYVLNWNAQTGFAKFVQITLLLLWTFLFASVLASLLIPLVRFYEGYWSFPTAGYFRRLGRAWHLSEWNRLITDKRHEEIYHFYPSRYAEDQVMPTALGNILKNAELYPERKYGVSSVLLWPRLFQVFPASFVEQLAIARAELEFMVLLCTLGAVFAVVSGAYLLIIGGSWWFFLLSFWGGFALSWVAYKSALNSSQMVGLQMKIAFDLYRNELLTQMRFPLPKNLEEEQMTWQKIKKFIYQNNDTGLPYVTPPAKSDLG